MSKRLQIKSVLNNDYVGKVIVVCGWVKTFRSNRFINLNDGSCLSDLQCLVDYEKLDQSKLSKINTGACLEVEGEIVKSQGRGQSVELIANNINILGESDPEKFPIQPKKHSFEFLRENAHLRVRTKTLSSVFRIRSEVSFAIHDFFNKNNFYYIHTPIITGSDAEGAGEMFKVTTLDSKKKNLDYSEDFFGKETNLTVSGQLEAESMAMGLGNVYTFGPTFRAENSNTSRHLSEFWMIEPEMAFYDLNDNMDLAEKFIQNVIKNIFEKCKDDIVFLSDRLEKEEMSKPKNQRSELSLLERIEFVINNNFKRVTYSDAFEILRNSKPNKKENLNILLKNGELIFRANTNVF